MTNTTDTRKFGADLLPKFRMTAYGWRTSNDARWDIHLDEKFYNLKGSRGRGYRVASYHVYDRTKPDKGKDQIVASFDTLREARTFIANTLWAEAREANTQTTIYSDPVEDTLNMIRTYGF